MRNSMAACPSSFAMSLAGLLVPGVNVMLGPVANSPGPEVTVSVTVTLSLISLPLPSMTVTSNQTSCVPSTTVSVVVQKGRVRDAVAPAWSVPQRWTAYGRGGLVEGGCGARRNLLL